MKNVDTALGPAQVVVEDVEDGERMNTTPTWYQKIWYSIFHRRELNDETKRLLDQLCEENAKLKLDLKIYQSVDNNYLWMKRKEQNEEC